MNYSFVYCMKHDDGFVVTGYHPNGPPEGYSMPCLPSSCEAHERKCDWCDWHTMGVIQFNDSNFEIIQSVRINYDRYGGGFIFGLYVDTLTNEKGEFIENNAALNEWIETISF